MRLTWARLHNPLVEDIGTTNSYWVTCLQLYPKLSLSAFWISGLSRGWWLSFSRSCSPVQTRRCGLNLTLYLNPNRTSPKSLHKPSPVPSLYLVLRLYPGTCPVPPRLNPVRCPLNLHGRSSLRPTPFNSPTPGGSTCRDPRYTHVSLVTCRGQLLSKIRSASASSTPSRRLRSSGGVLPLRRTIDRGHNDQPRRP